MLIANAVTLGVPPLPATANNPHHRSIVGKNCHLLLKESLWNRSSATECMRVATKWNLLGIRSWDLSAGLTLVSMLNPLVGAFENVDDVTHREQ